MLYYCILYVNTVSVQAYIALQHDCVWLELCDVIMQLATIRTKVVVLLGAFFLLSTTVTQWSLREPRALYQPRRNVLFLISDDLRPELGVYRDHVGQIQPNIHTPHLDSLASSSLLATRAFVQYSCAPQAASACLPVGGPIQHAFITYMTTGATWGVTLLRSHNTSSSTAIEPRE